MLTTAFHLARLLFQCLMLLSFVAALTSTPEYAAANARGTDAIDLVFSEWNRDDSPGCALGIYREGEIQYSKGYGLANLEHGVPIGPDTVFRIGSSSKQFTAACAVLLVQDGALSWHDDVRKWIPELHDHQLTIWHLLTETSGVRDYRELMALAGIADSSNVTEERVFRLLARQRGLNHVPGRRPSYGTSDYFLMSIVVQRASGGMSLRETAHERIFEPLDMHSTHFHDDAAEIVPNRATGHVPKDGGGWQIAETAVEAIGDAGLYTSVTDYLAWDRNFDEPTVGGPELVAALTKNYVSANRGLGLRMGAYRGLETVSHGGASLGFRAHALRFPGERTTIVVFANASSVDAMRLCRSVADLVLAERFPAPPEGRYGGRHSVGDRNFTVHQPQDYAGSYASEELGVVYDLAALDGALFLEYPWGERVRLGARPRRSPPAGNYRERFAAPENRILRFSRTDDVVSGFTLDAPGARGLVFERVRD